MYIVGDKMNQSIETIKQEFKNCLYKNNIENDELDKINVQKCLFELLRECIKEREYIVEVGAYLLNIEPSQLSVKYETDETIVEISNEDVYYETTRELEVRYFALEDKETYSIDAPVIEVTGMITNVDGVMEESYELELLTEKEDDIKNYLNVLSDGFVYSDLEMSSPYNVILARQIRKDTPRFDVFELFKLNRVVPVVYDYVNNSYKKDEIRKEFHPNNYSNYLPNLSDKKDLVSFLYSSIIEFYSEYLNNQ